MQRSEAKKFIPRQELEDEIDLMKFEKRIATNVNRRVERRMARRCKARSDILLTTFVDRSMLYFHLVGSFTNSGELNCTVLLSFIHEDNALNELQMLC